MIGDDLSIFKQWKKIILDTYAHMCKYVVMAGTKQSLPGTDFFKALCDPNRLAILHWLAGRVGARNVGEISQCCPVDLSVVSRHLALMKQAGLLKAEKRGKEVYYSIQTGSLPQVLRGLADYFDNCCCATDTKKTKKKKEK